MGSLSGDPENARDTRYAADHCNDFAAPCHAVSHNDDATVVDGPRPRGKSGCINDHPEHCEVRAGLDERFPGGRRCFSLMGHRY